MQIIVKDNEGKTVQTLDQNEAFVVLTGHSSILNHVTLPEVFSLMGMCVTNMVMKKDIDLEGAKALLRAATNAMVNFVQQKEEQEEN